MEHNPTDWARDPGELDRLPDNAVHRMLAQIEQSLAMRERREPPTLIVGDDVYTGFLGIGGARQFSRARIADAIEVLIALLDVSEPDPEHHQPEDGDELDGSSEEDDLPSASHGWGTAGCPIADPSEDDDPGGGNITDEPHDGEDSDNGEVAAWPERIDQTRFPKRLDGWHGGCVHEDVEDDDRDGCLAADDDPKRRVADGRPGDSSDAEEDDPGGGNVDDEGEREQMVGDVPNPSAVSLEPDPFTGKRQQLGHTNLQPSFVDNGGGARDAFTGRVQYRHGRTGKVRFDRPWGPRLADARRHPLGEV